MSEWRVTHYQPPTLWDRIRGYEHHDCEYCRDVARFPRLHVMHPPNTPPPPPSVPPPYRGVR